MDGIASGDVPHVAEVILQSAGDKQLYNKLSLKMETGMCSDCLVVPN